MFAINMILIAFTTIIFAAMTVADPLFAPSNTTLESLAPRYGLRCNDHHLNTIYMENCRAGFLGDKYDTVITVGDYAGRLCEEAGSVKVSCRAADARGAQAMGREIGDAIGALIANCQYRGGSVSAAYDPSTGKDFIVHISNQWV